MQYVFGYLLIFVSRLIDVSLTTIRTLFVVKGMKKEAAFIGFFEITVYVLALGSVMNNLNNPLNLLSYALGFSCGNYLGITIENKIALGNLSIQIIPSSKEDNIELKKVLREKGFAVTVLLGEGLRGERELLFITINRKDLGKIRDIVAEYDDKAFMTVNDVHSLRGGYFADTKL